MPVRIELGVEDLARTRFAISPLGEAAHSLRALSDPSAYALHLPWLRATEHRLDPADAGLLRALVGPTRIPIDYPGTPSQAIPDFLTPLPTRFIAPFSGQLAAIRATPTAVVRGDLIVAHAPDPIPPPLRAARRGDARAVRRLLGAICDALARYWELAFDGVWTQMRLVLEADTTYRARQLAAGGARELFADIHPNVRWDAGVLTVSEMIDDHTVRAAGRGLLLIPSIFAAKPAPPIDPAQPPSLAYPSRGIATLWAPAPEPDPTALTDLLGRRRAWLVQMLAEPLTTAELARRLRVTPSAVSQHLRVLHATGLVTRARDRRQVLYRRSPLGDGLVERPEHPERPERL